MSSPSAVSGHAVWAWEFFDTTLSRRVIQAAFRSAGGSFAIRRPVSASTRRHLGPAGRGQRGGVATVAWQESLQRPVGAQVAHPRVRRRLVRDPGRVSDGFINLDHDVVVDGSGIDDGRVGTARRRCSPRRILYSTRPAGGDWDAPSPSRPLTSGFGEPSLAIDAEWPDDGRLHRLRLARPTSWRRPGRRVARGPTTGLVSALPDGAEARRPTVAMDDDGQAVVGVARLDADRPSRPGTRARHRTVPLSAGLSIPATATVGQPVVVRLARCGRLVGRVVGRLDLRRRLRPSSGASVAKTYPSTGTYAVSVTATDAVGNATTLTGQHHRDARRPRRRLHRAVVKPTLTGVKLTKKTIHVVASDEKPRATKLKLTLNTDAKVVVKLKRTNKVDGKARQREDVPKALHAGKRAIRLTSKVGGKKLPPGTYQVTVRARNAAGFSATKTLRLTIVRVTESVERADGPPQPAVERPAGRGATRPRRPRRRGGRGGRSARRASRCRARHGTGSPAAPCPLGVGLAQQRHPLGRLVHQHPGVVDGAGDEQVGPGAGLRRVVVRRVGQHRVEVLAHPGVAPLVPLGDRQRDRVVEHRGDHVDERHLGHDRAPAVGTLAEGRARQQAAGTEPSRRDAVGIDQPRGGQPVGDRDVVVEGVLLGRQPAVEPPATAPFRSSPDVRERVDHPTVEQRGQRLLPLPFPDRLVGAVAEEHRRRRAVERGVAVPHDRGGHEGPVGRGEAAHLCHVRRRVVARGLVAVGVGHRAVGQRRPARAPAVRSGPRR